MKNRDTDVLYVLQLTALKDNTFRLHVNEKNPLHPRYEVEYVLQGPPQVSKLELVEKTKERVVVKNGNGKAIINANPFRVDLYSGEELVISANAKGLMRFEHIRQKPEP